MPALFCTVQKGKEDKRAGREKKDRSKPSPQRTTHLVLRRSILTFCSFLFAGHAFFFFKKKKKRDRQTKTDVCSIYHGCMGSFASVFLLPFKDLSSYHSLCFFIIYFATTPRDDLSEWCELILCSLSLKLFSFPSSWNKRSTVHRLEIDSREEGLILRVKKRKRSRLSTRAVSISNSRENDHSQHSFLSIQSSLTHGAEQTRPVDGQRITTCCRCCQHPT